MTRLELLTILIGKARENGFEFRRWYTTRLGVPWISPEAALKLLESQRRYYALLFSHEFAQSFWKSGAEITFQVPSQTFSRVTPSGDTATVTRKGFTRRTARKDVWKYHLREMANAEEPLRYIRRYLNVEDELDDYDIPLPAETTDTKSKSGKTPLRQKPKPLPKDLPSFLKRPYKS